MMLINPLLEIDMQMDELKDQSEAKDMWVGDLRDLYLVDVEVDGGTKKFTSTPQSIKKEEVQVSDMDENAIKSKEQDPDHIPPKQHTEEEEAKVMLSQHLPQVPLEYCPTSPQHTSMTTTTEQASDFALPPPVPMSPPLSTRRAIFSAKEKKIDNAATTVAPPQANVTTTPKRSIFSKQEKAQVRES